MSKFTIARAVCGAVLATVIACGDSPTANAPTPKTASSAAVATLAGFSLSPNLMGGERTMHRNIVLPDGRRITIDGVRGADGLPRDLQISQEGVVVARVRNEWRTIGNAIVLDRQQLVRYDLGVVASAFDTRGNGGVEQAAGAPISVLAPPTADENGVVRKVKFAGYFADYASGGFGPCDAQAAAVAAAMDDWLLSVLAAGAATVTGQPVMAWSAYAYQLKKWRDVMRAEAALDECVANAGRPPEYW